MTSTQSSGASSWTKWPAPAIRSSVAPGIADAHRSAHAHVHTTSASPNSRCTGPSRDCSCSSHRCCHAAPLASGSANGRHHGKRRAPAFESNPVNGRRRRRAPRRRRGRDGGANRRRCRRWACRRRDARGPGPSGATSGCPRCTRSRRGAATCWRGRAGRSGRAGRTRCGARAARPSPGRTGGSGAVEPVDERPLDLDVAVDTRPRRRPCRSGRTRRGRAPRRGSRRRRGAGSSAGRGTTSSARRGSTGTRRRPADPRRRSARAGRRRRRSAARTASRPGRRSARPVSARPAGSRRHSLEADEGAGVLDLAHVAEAVLVDPALRRVEAGDPGLAGDAGAVRRRELWRERPGDDDVGEAGGVERRQHLLGLANTRPRYSPNAS